jgi:hypothetical protein
VKVEAAEAKYSFDLVFSIDETSWKNVQLKRRAIAPKTTRPLFLRHMEI